MARHFRQIEQVEPTSHRRRNPLPFIVLGIVALVVAAGAFVLLGSKKDAASPESMSSQEPLVSPDEGSHKDAPSSDAQAPADAKPDSSESTTEEPLPATEPDTSTLAGLFEAEQVSSIRVLGDSITAGYLIEGFDAPSDTGTVVYEGGEGTYYETPTTVACWTNAFRSYAADHGVGSFVNAGVSGFRMQYLAEDPAAWLGEGADVIVVMLGTNDAAKVSVDEFRTYAEQALTACDEACQHLVVVSPPDNERTDAQNLYGMDQIDQALADVSTAHGWEHVSLLDALQVGSGDFFEDQVHPTETGSANLWEAFRGRLGLPA